MSRGFVVIFFLILCMVYCSGSLQWCSSQCLQGVNHAPYILHKAAVQQKGEGGRVKKGEREGCSKWMTILGDGWATCKECLSEKMEAVNG